MALPPDFDETLAEITKLGIVNEPPGPIRDRLVLAVRTAAQTSTAKDLAGGDLGLIDWSTKVLHKAGDALHQELCDSQKGELKEQYKELLAKATTDDGLRAIGSAVTTVLATINPALAVSSVVVYFSLWLAKVGLNYWCKQTTGT
jgi:hypothetical protein